MEIMLEGFSKEDVLVSTTGKASRELLRKSIFTLCPIILA